MRRTQTDVVHGGAVSPVADPTSPGAVQVPALPSEVTADDHSVTRPAVHPSVVGRRRCRTTDYCTKADSSTSEIGLVSWTMSIIKLEQHPNKRIVIESLLEYFGIRNCEILLVISAARRLEYSLSLIGDILPTHSFTKSSTKNVQKCKILTVVLQQEDSWLFR